MKKIKIFELVIKKRNLPHWIYEGSFYFITFCTKDRAILSDEEKDLVFNHIREGNSKFYHLVCLVVMPDHVHLILKPLANYELSRIMKGIKGVSSHKINKLRKTSVNIWQSESYDRIIRDYSELNEKVNYMFNNPIKKGICEDGNKYQWWFLNEEYDYYE